MALNYIEQLFILVSVITGCVLISAFCFASWDPIGIVIPAVRLKIYAITTVIKKYKLIIQKKKKHYKIYC